MDTHNTDMLLTKDTTSATTHHAVNSTTNGTANTTTNDTTNAVKHGTTNAATHGTTNAATHGTTNVTTNGTAYTTKMQIKTHSDDTGNSSSGDKSGNKLSEINTEKQQNETDPSNLSRKQKENIIADSLKRRRYKRSRSRRKLTIADVKEDAAKILEEFLQEQLQRQSIQTSSPEYQRFVEVSVTETTTPSFESSVNLASSSSLLREDSIPFADEDIEEYELRKAESLPHDKLANFQGVSPSQSLPVHHAKSRSAPYQGGEEALYRPKRTIGGSVKETPPAPPGTPYSPSDSGSNDSHSVSIPVPYTGRRPTDSSLQPSLESLDNINNTERCPSPVKVPRPAKVPESSAVQTSDSMKSRSQTPVSENDTNKNDVVRPKTLLASPHVKGSPKKSLKDSGWASSSDTDGVKDFHSQGRKKKSMFKKAQERLHHAFSRKKNRLSTDDSIDDYSVGSGDLKPKHRKKPRRHDTVDECDVADALPLKVLEDKYIHKNQHIHQTHSPHDSNTVIRSEEAMETVDIVNDKEKKHIEKHTKVKQSSGSAGFMDKIRRLTTRGKKMKGSQSEQWGHDQEDGMHGAAYMRGISMPSHPGGEDQTDNSHLRMYGNHEGFEFSSMQNHPTGSNTRETLATQVVCREEDKDMGMHRNSSYLDIVDHSGKMIERLYVDEHGNELPRNKSFEFQRDTYIHERRVNDHGREKIIRDEGHHDHLEISDDGKRLEDLSDGEKEELYGKIASRLAAIGDNLMLQKELDKSRSSSTSPSHKMPECNVASPEQENVPGKLNPLEQEISDALKEFAAGVDERLSANARTAALRIAGVVTYNHFKNVVQQSVGNGDGWDQVAAVFKITKQAINLAGSSGALAMQIKEMSLKYIEDRFAGWIVGQGGWDSMLSESDTESEVD